MMKKFFALALASALTLSLLVGCGKKDDPSVSGSSSGSISGSSRTDTSTPEDASSSADSSQGKQPDASQPEEKPADKKVDLPSFSQTIQGSYQFGFLSVLDHDLTEQLYPGLTAIPANQLVVNGCMMSNNMGEFVLVEVKDSKDVDSAKSILNARIKTMADGGAFYPEATEMWSQSAKVVSNGNFVMMIVHEKNAEIVKAFNNLFK